MTTIPQGLTETRAMALAMFEHQVPCFFQRGSAMTRRRSSGRKSAMCEQEQPVRQYIQHGPGGVHYVRQDGDIVTADVDGVLDGDLDKLLEAKIRRRAEETTCG